MQHNAIIRISTVFTVSALAVLSASRAIAGLPEMEQALTGRASSEWKSACPEGSVTGVACQGKVCGKDFTLDAAAPSRFLTVNGKAYDLHDTANGIDLGVADLLNALCSVGASEPFAVGDGSLATQNMQMETFMRYSALPSDVVPGPLLSVGLMYEHGTDTNALSLPVAYSKNLSREQFINVTGHIAYAGRTDAKQFAFDASPAFGMLVDKGKLTYGLGGYVPLAFSSSTVSKLDTGFSSLAVGVGGIGTITALVSENTVSGGVSFAGRATSNGVAIPFTGMGRVIHPFSPLLDGFAMVSYGVDPLTSKTGFFMGGFGASFGKYELGYRGYFGSGHTAHTVGFMMRHELAGSEKLERPAGDAEETKSDAESEEEPED